MREEFKGLSPREYEKLKNAISEITVLIAGADGTIQESEKNWAEKVTKIRSYTLPPRLAGFYKEVGIDFKEKLDVWVDKFLTDQEGTIQEIKFRLAELNGAFAKLEDKRIAYELYLSFRSFARHVARATGGFLGWGAIGPEEDEMIGLTMIEPVPPPHIEKK